MGAGISLPSRFNAARPLEKLNSCLYRAQVMHCRLVPKVHKFLYKVFLFYIDLDELDRLSRKLLFFSRNRFNIYGFFDGDYFTCERRSLKEKVLDYLAENDIDLEDGRIMLLTFPRVWGFLFNPVSVYFCFDRYGYPACAIAELKNAAGEIKPYLIGADDMSDDGVFRKMEEKNFYLSPFMPPDVHFDFRLRIPEQKLEIFIDDYQNGKVALLASLIGGREPLNNRRLFWSTLEFPWMTLKMMLAFHWNVSLLAAKRIRAYSKADHADLQKIK